MLFPNTSLLRPRFLVFVVFDSSQERALFRAVLFPLIAQLLCTYSALMLGAQAALGYKLPYRSYKFYKLPCQLPREFTEAHEMTLAGYTFFFVHTWGYRVRSFDSERLSGGQKADVAGALDPSREVC